METPAELQHFILSKPLLCPCPDFHQPQDTVPYCGIKILKEYFSLGSSSFPNKSFLSGESCRIPPKSLSDFCHLGWILRGSRCRTTPLTKRSHISGAGSAGIQPRHSEQPHTHSPPWCPASPGLPPQPLPSPHTWSIHSHICPSEKGIQKVQNTLKVHRVGIISSPIPRRSITESLAFLRKMYFCENRIYYHKI